MRLRLNARKLSRRTTLVVLGLCAGLAAMAQTPQLSPDWHLFRANEERTGYNRSSNGRLTAADLNVSTRTPALRWIFPHNMPEPAVPLNPIPYNVGGGVGSPVCGPVEGAQDGFLVAYGTFQNVNVQGLPGQAPFTMEAGVVWGMSGFRGAGETGYFPEWWFGYRDVPVDQAVSGGGTTWTQRERSFLQQVSQRIVESYTDTSSDQTRLRTSRPLGAVRSTPALVKLSDPMSYTAVTVDLAGNKASVQRSTRDLLIFGADDGFVYCLDASPRNTIVYEMADEDPARPRHRTEVAPLIWRFDTLSLIQGTGANPQVIQVASSPVAAAVGTETQPSIFVGTGVGYMVRLNLRGGLVWKYKTNPLIKTQTFESPLGHAISSSPSFFKNRIYFGAADSLVYCLNAATGDEVWHFTTGAFDADKDRERNRAGLFSPPVVSTVALGENVPGKGDLAFVTASGVLDSPDGQFARSLPSGQLAGAVYALNASTGAKVWTFDRWKNPLGQDPDKEIFIGSFRASPSYGEYPVRSLTPNVQGVCVRSEDGNVYLLDAAEGTMLWDVPFSLTGEDLESTEQFTGSPAVSNNGYIFLVSKDGVVRAIFPGALAALRKETGEEDDTRRPVGEEVWSERTGVLVNQPPTGRETTPTQVFQGRPAFSTPAISRGMLFVAGGGHLFAYQDINGSGEWGGPGYQYIPFDPNNPNAPRPSQSQTPGSTLGARERIHVDIFDHATYTNTASAPFEDDHSQAMGITGSPPWTFATPGRLEWGDGIHVIAWNLDERVPTALLRVQGPNGTIQVTVPVRTRSDGRGEVGKKGVARYTFVLDPVSARIVDPRNPSATMPNPFAQLPLTPGGEGTPTWTVSAVQNRLGGDGKPDANATSASSEQDVRSRFRINNPIDLQVGSVTSLREPFNNANGRNPNEGLGSVPIVRFSVGDHGTQSVPERFVVVDRSHLKNVQRATEAGNPEAPEGTLPPDAPRPVLSVKVAPAEMQWLGGPQAVYKPLFLTYDDGSPAWLGSRTLPTSALQGVNSILESAPPAPIGQPNSSLDYPNIRAEQVVVRRVRDGSDAVRRDAAVGDETGLTARQELFEYAVNIPRYQPANGDPEYPLGPGYATVNPLNRFTRDILQGSFTYRPVYPQDNVHLTRVYVDSSRNGSHDANEAYRTLVTGVKVRVDESLEVVEQTVEIPGAWQGPASALPPPPGVPHGYVPFTDYWGYQIPNAGPFLVRESPFYRPFTIVNTGNVNLWNVRMEKRIPFVEPLFSPTVDPHYVINPTSGQTSFTGAISPGNLFSTLDVPPGGRPDDPLYWTPIRKSRVGSVDPTRIVIRNPFQSETGEGLIGTLLPQITVAVPLGTPVGKYVTQPVFFEDGQFQGPGRSLLGANGIFDPQLRTPAGGVRPEAAAPRKMVVSVEVMESRLTDYPPLPATAASAGTVEFPLLLPNVDRQRLPGQQSADPTAYRSADGSLHLLFARARPDLTPTAPDGTPLGNTPWYLTGSDLPFNRNFGPDNPWGWTYGNAGPSFFLPLDTSKWWMDPSTEPLPPPNSAPGVDVFSAPSVVSDGQNAWLFFQGLGTVFDPEGGGAQTRSRLFYVRLDGSRPVGDLMAVPGDESIPREFPKPFTYVDAQGQTRVGVMWQSGSPGPTGIFVSTTATPANPDSWTPPKRLAVASGLSSATSPSPSFKPLTDPGKSAVEVVFSGTNKTDQNADLFLMRYSTTDWEPVALPRVAEERLLRQPGRPVYSAIGIDWQLTHDLLPVIRWVNPDGTDKRHYQTGTVLKADLVDLDEAARRLVYRDTTNTYTITVDAAAGTVSFAANDPLAPLPRDQDRVLVSYSPRAWRLTTDARSDTQPIYFVDRSSEWVNPQLTPWRVASSVSANQPFLMPRSRMWVIWRKGNSGVGGGGSGVGGGGSAVGTLGSTTLFYKTYRLIVALPSPIQVHPNTQAPDVTVAGATGKWTVDPQSGRIFFSEVDEGRPVQITYNGGVVVNSFVSWLPEGSTPANREVAVPLKMPVNEGQVWAFKDPFSYVENLSPDSPGYMNATNNNIWLFWSSTRGGAGDLYYMTLSPRL